MIRRLALAAALCLATAIPAAAQSSLSPAAPHDSTQCATLHAMMVQHMTAMGMDSTQIAALHASLKDAVAHGASPDSLHHALLQGFMQSMHGSGADMSHMTIDSAHVAAIHACLASHAGASPEKPR